MTSARMVMLGAMALSMSGLTTVAWAVANPSAAGDPVAARQAVMKRLGTTMRDGGAFAAGRTPWDAAAASKLMKEISAQAKTLPGLFPAGSGASPTSAADPKIWTARADFNKQFAEMNKLAQLAAKAKTADQFKGYLTQLGGTCKGCHDTYRRKKS